MAINPYPPRPRGKDNESMYDFPSPRLAITRNASENSTASSVITVNDRTTAIEIAAVGGPAVMRWVARSDTQGSVISAAGTANFDHVIPTATYRQFAIPIELAPNSSSFPGPSSMVGANSRNGLYQRVAIKSIGVASVLLTEYGD